MNLTMKFPFFSRTPVQQPKPTVHDRVATFSSLWLLIYALVTGVIALGASALIFSYQVQNIEAMQLAGSENMLRKSAALLFEAAKIALFILASVFFAVKGGRRAWWLGMLIWLFGAVVIFSAKYGMIEKNNFSINKSNTEITSLENQIFKKRNAAEQSQVAQSKATEEAGMLNKKASQLALAESWRKKGSPIPATNSHDILKNATVITNEATRHGADMRAANQEADRLQQELNKLRSNSKSSPTEVAAFGMAGARYAAMVEGVILSFIDMKFWELFGVGIAVLAVRRNKNQGNQKGFLLKLVEMVWGFFSWAVIGIIAWVFGVIQWAFSFITPPTPAKKTPSSPPTLPDFLQPEAPTPESVKLIAQVPATAEVKPVVTAANDETKALKQPDTPLIEQPESAPATPAIESVAPAAPAAPAKQPNAAKPKAKIVTAAQQTQGKSMRDLMANAAFVGVALGAAGAPTSIAHAAPVNQESSPPTLFGDASAEELQFNQITEMVRNKGFSPSVANLKKHMKCGDVPATKMRNRLLCERIVMMNKDGNGYVVIRDL